MEKIQDFITLFNVLWYRDFPLTVDWREHYQKTDWTIHIAVCVRSAADLLGYFTYFEAGRTDAVIKDGNERVVANVEWEWKQPHEDGFNELEKLKRVRKNADFSVLVTYSRNPNIKDIKKYHDLNMNRISETWKCDETLLLFLVRYDWIPGRGYSGRRQFNMLETYSVQQGKCDLIRSQQALPWKFPGTRWAKYEGGSNEG